MTIFDSATIFLTLTAAFAYINQKTIKLPTDIGVMALALLSSVFVLFLDSLGFSILREFEAKLVNQLDFSQVLLDVMLSILLFAGALHIRSKDLKIFRIPVSALAFIGTIVSTVIVGTATYFIMPLLGIELSLIWCLIFGALISPTDPIAVMGILTSIGAPKSVETVISGESLYNDGVGVVIFVLLLGVLHSGDIPSLSEGLSLFAKEAIGGIMYGYLLGQLTYRLLKSIDEYQEQTLIMLSAVLGGYALAQHLHVSGPLAMVVVGLIVGNKVRFKAMNDKSREYTDMFWQLLDRILNSILFVLIGLEVIVITYNFDTMLASVIAIMIALGARLIVVCGTTGILGKRMGLPKGSWKILTWGGLRGGISIALVLSLPESLERDLLLNFTYSIVVFSILIQGLTVGKLAEKLVAANK